MFKFKKAGAVIIAVLLLMVSMPVPAGAAIGSNADDLIGRWERYGDGAEGTIVTVKKAGNIYQATLEKVKGTLVDLAFAVGDMKWKDVKWVSSGNYTGKDMFRYESGGYEYWNSALSIDSNGILKMSVAKSGDVDVSIGTYQTWRKLASSWAEPEIQKATEYGLTTTKVLRDYQGNITREEFCEMAVKLYEALSSMKAVPISPNPFTDSTNPEVLKAYKLGIVTGTSKTTFSPNNPATREQMSGMLLRTIKAARPAVIVDISGVQAFADEKEISTYAVEAVKFLNKLGVINGIGGGKIGPKANTTREQSIAMIKRVYENYMK